MIENLRGVYRFAVLIKSGDLGVANMIFTRPMTFTMIENLREVYRRAAIMVLLA